MRAVLQRVAYASVKVNGEVVGKTEKGVLLLVGIDSGDDEKDFQYILDKTVNLRIFEDKNDKMNLSVADIGGGVLIIPNFTVYADARKGRRPSFVMAAKPEDAEIIFNKFCEKAREFYENVQTGIFRADMKVELLNDGPVTIILDSDKIL